MLDDFVQRQLNDTAYISRCVSQYLRCLGARVVCTRGDMTADVRHWWGLNSILQPDGSDRKNRDDHRHHAIDALVIALTDDEAAVCPGERPRRRHAAAVGWLSRGGGSG